MCEPMRATAMYGGPVEYASIEELRRRVIDTNGLDPAASAELQRRWIAAKIAPAATPLSDPIAALRRLADRLRPQPGRPFYGADAQLRLEIRDHIRELSERRARGGRSASPPRKSTAYMKRG